jgi:Na+/proline symporter
MNYLDWIVLAGTITFIVLYGAWKTTGSKNIEGYLKGDNSMKWWMIGVSIMATQASAVTFLSTPVRRWKMECDFFNFILDYP